jgi:hypothetical protein
MVATAQLSVEPLFTWAAVIEPVPAAFSITVTFWQRALGGWLSTTVTVKEHVETPTALVAVAVTVVVPIGNVLPGLIVYVIVDGGMPVVSVAV